eukprot:scaffold2035_cov101-Isochrysis_galbana.AAC.3
MAGGWWWWWGHTMWARYALLCAMMWGGLCARWRDGKTTRVRAHACLSTPPRAHTPARAFLVVEAPAPAQNGHSCDPAADGPAADFAANRSDSILSCRPPAQPAPAPLPAPVICLHTASRFACSAARAATM